MMFAGGTQEHSVASVGDCASRKKSPHVLQYASVTTCTAVVGFGVEVTNANPRTIEPALRYCVSALS